MSPLPVRFSKCRRIVRPVRPMRGTACSTFKQKYSASSVSTLRSAFVGECRGLTGWFAGRVISLGFYDGLCILSIGALILLYRAVPDNLGGALLLYGFEGKGVGDDGVRLSR